MRVLNACEVVHLWELGAGRGHVERAALCLAAVLPQVDSDGLEALTLGRRNRALLEVYQHVGGQALAGLATCPECGETLEFRVDPAVLGALSGVAGWSEERPRFHRLDVPAGHWTVEFRLLDGTDLTAASACSDVPMARRTLVERCVVQARQNGEPVLAEDLPGEVVNAIAEALCEHDPGAELRLCLACARCAASWSALLDVTEHLWDVLERTALHLLNDVHRLAKAYGWREDEVLALTPRRRRAYLELCGT